MGIYSLRRRVLWWRDTVTSCSRVNRHARHTSFAQISTANYLQAVFADLQLQVSPRLVCIPVAAVSTTICCFRSVSTTLSRNPSAARDANPNHRHGFPWFLLRCSCIVDCFNCLLHSVTRIWQSLTSDWCWKLLFNWWFMLLTSLPSSRQTSVIWNVCLLLYILSSPRN